MERNLGVLPTWLLLLTHWIYPAVRLALLLLAPVLPRSGWRPAGVGNRLPLTLSSGPARKVTACNLKVMIKNADLSEEMQPDSAECASQVLEKYNRKPRCGPH